MPPPRENPGSATVIIHRMDTSGVENLPTFCKVIGSQVQFREFPFGDGILTITLHV